MTQNPETAPLNSAEGTDLDALDRGTYTQLRTLIQRAHDADKAALKKFFQEEGVRARIF